MLLFDPQKTMNEVSLVLNDKQVADFDKRERVELDKYILVVVVVDKLAPIEQLVDKIHNIPLTRPHLLHKQCKIRDIFSSLTSFQDKIKSPDEGDWKLETTQQK